MEKLMELTAQRCYELLGLTPGATLAQIRAKRGQLAQQWHPDKETDPARKARLEDQMKDINNAFDFLKAFLSGTPPGPSPALHRPPATPPTPGPAAKKPWDAEAEERRRQTAEREARERRERAAQQREWKAKFQREQADAARQRAQQQAETARLHAWFAEEKERQEQEGKPRDRRHGSPRSGRPPKPSRRTRHTSLVLGSYGLPCGTKAGQASTSICAGAAPNVAEAKSRLPAMTSLVLECRRSASHCCARRSDANLSPRRRRRRHIRQHGSRDARRFGPL